MLRPDPSVFDPSVFGYEVRENFALKGRAGGLYRRNVVTSNLLELQ